MKGHSGYFGCDRCCIRGETVSNRRVFTQTSNLEKRTDESFRNQVKSEHHKGNTLFLNLEIDMILSFPIDYMHCACIGIMKKLILIWVNGIGYTKDK